MNLKGKSTDLERITELSHIVNDMTVSSSNSSIVKLFHEEDIYHRFSQEVTILGNIHKHKYSFFKRMKAKMKLYDIYSKTEDEAIGNAVINEIGNPNIFYVICNSILNLH